MRLHSFLCGRRLRQFFLRAFILLSLFFPAFYSPYFDIYQSAYYQGFSWAYFFLTGYLLLCIVSEFGRWRSSERKHWGRIVPYTVLLIAYNAFSLYYNYTALHWYWEEFNNTVGFVTFLVLMALDVDVDGEKDNNIRFLIHCIILSNLASLIYYHLGYLKFMVCNNQFLFYRWETGNYSELRHYWIYSHKSEYALMLVAFLALFVAYRDKFRNRLTYLLSLLLLLVCLYISHSWSGMAGAVLILAGDFLDRVVRHHFRWWYLLVGAGAAAAAGTIGFQILKERDITTLGSRTLIWQAALEVIVRYPQGWGLRFGESAITDLWGIYFVNNAHNVFLNQILRFSIPVGICFILLFVFLIGWSLVKSRSFRMAGLWAALLILMNMDYALMSTSVAMLLLIIYLVASVVPGRK